jgi:hypothetical protein
MAKLAPFFLTGANAKIKLNGKTMAFVTDLSYTVDVPHAAPVLLGNYEAASLGPLSYKVNGTFTLIRYVGGVAEDLKGRGYKIPKGVHDEGNGVGNWGPESFAARNGILSNDGQAHKSLNPADFDNAVRFDIEIYQKAVNKNNLFAVARLKDCRIARASFTINKKSPAMQNFTFQAIYADEDSFVTAMSGEGQQFG